MLIEFGKIPPEKENGVIGDTLFPAGGYFLPAATGRNILMENNENYIRQGQNKRRNVRVAQPQHTVSVIGSGGGVCSRPEEEEGARDLLYFRCLSIFLPFSDDEGPLALPFSPHVLTSTGFFFTTDRNGS